VNAGSAQSGTETELRLSEFHVAGLDCANEARQIRRALADIDIIARVDFDLLRGRMIVRHDAENGHVENIVREGLRRIGMRAVPWNERHVAGRQQSARGNRDVLAVGAAGIALAAGLILETLGAIAPSLVPLAKGCLLIAIAAGLANVLSRGIRNLFMWRIDMNVLMSVAVLGAAVIGEWAEAATVSFLFLVSLQLEAWSVARARKAIGSLLRLTPPTARRKDESGNAWNIVDPSIVEPGDLIEVWAGERIPLDGEIVAGRGHVDQSPITGESRPVSKSPGDSVFAGSLCLDATLELKAARRSDDSVLSRVVREVEKAQTERAETERWIDRFAAKYTPIVMTLAVVIAIVPPLAGFGDWLTWTYRALVLLVIACPCALVISTPVTMVAALAAAARAGVLVRGAKYLELAAQARGVAFDKTGTITLGRPVVREVRPMPGHNHTAVLSLAAGLEAKSSHPLASAINRLAHETGIEPVPVEDIRQLPGVGISGRSGEQTAWIGGPAMLDARRVNTESLDELKRASESGRTVVAVGVEDAVLGVLIIGDEPREGVNEAVQALRQLRIGRIVMLTGDHAGIAGEMAHSAGIGEVHANLLPNDKLRLVRQLQAENAPLLMVGDGINDAPALAAADVGIAMGRDGTDVAIESADVALMSNDLALVPWLVRHARRTLGVVRQNVIFALGLKLAFLLLAMIGYSPMWLAVAADTGASLLVTANGLRMIRRTR
jgi:Cd2+/Zn2+-exporting ATPase